jgi:hypothetical protein
LPAHPIALPGLAPALPGLAPALPGLAPALPGLARGSQDLAIGAPLIPIRRHNLGPAAGEVAVAGAEIAVACRAGDAGDGGAAASTCGRTRVVDSRPVAWAPGSRVDCGVGCGVGRPLAVGVGAGSAVAVDSSTDERLGTGGVVDGVPADRVPADAVPVANAPPAGTGAGTWRGVAVGGRATRSRAGPRVAAGRPCGRAAPSGPPTCPGATLSPRIANGSSARGPAAPPAMLSPTSNR